MRLAIAHFELESVTFLPNPTDIPEFERAAKRGTAVIEDLRNTNTVVGGFLAVCEREGVEPIGILSACPGTAAGGAASDAAFDKYVGEILEALRRLRGEIDGVLLNLHGALATPTRQRADLDVLRLVRETVGPDLPIGLGLDLHGNLGAEVAELATIVCGYHHSPHTDMGRTGERTASLLIRAIRGEIRPVVALRKPGVMLPSIFTATALRPLADIMRRARAWEAREPKLLDVTVFCGFAYADVPDCGMSVVAIADGDSDLAVRAAQDLSDQARLLRHHLFRRDLIHDVPGGMEAAMRLAETAKKPIVLLEHADRLNDSTYGLRELLARGARPAMVPYLFDPEVARQCIAAGAGARVTVRLGGKTSPQAGGPVELTGTVVWAGHKRYRITGPLRTGMEADLGETAIIDADGIVVSVVSVQWSAIDRDCFDQFGLDPANFRYVLLRSKTHFRKVWEPLAEAIIIIDTPDWGPADLTRLPYRQLPPGVFPVTAAD